jgi:nicotinamide phosphoribosyltransferase
MKTNIFKQNFAVGTDSYKVNHHKVYPDDAEVIHSYFEARKGSEYPETVFFGLQFLLKTLEGVVVTSEDVEEAYLKMKHHFWGNPDCFHYEGFKRLVEKHKGKLPVRIRAVPEGTIVPINNVLFTIENTDEEFPWLTNFLETYLTHVWHPMTVATKSYHVKKLLQKYLDKTADDHSLLPFLLHDFGYRGVAGNEAAGRGGAGHLVNFLGTDTMVAMDYAEHFYGASYEGLGYSVFATEHSVMTADGEDGEKGIIQKVLDTNPVGIISVVNDSYNDQRHVGWLCGEFKEQILARHANAPEGIPTKFVTRPDSVPEGETAEDIVLDIYNRFAEAFGTTTNSKGYKELNPAVGVIWGDGIDFDGIEKILETLEANGYSTSAMAFGMGGGLLQKVNRDTQRCAFKCSAQKRGGEWIDIQKKPRDISKASKAGRQALYKTQLGEYITTRVETLEKVDATDILETVFENGEIVKEYTFAEVRENANF